MTKAEARAIGKQWAEDRFRTNTTWKAFLLNDALATCSGDADLAHLICETASRHWRILEQRKQ